MGKALISVLELTRWLRVLQAAEDSEDEGLEPLPVQDDPALSVYAGCVVCFAAVADMLLMPCRHLTLCEVWACAICCGWGVGLMWSRVAVLRYMSACERMALCGVRFVGRKSRIGYVTWHY